METLFHDKKSENSFSLEKGHLACDYYFDLKMLHTEQGLH